MKENGYDLHRTYRLKAYFHIKHSFSGDIKKAHPHTLTVTCTVVSSTAEMIQYKTIEATLKKCLDKYDHHYLNEIEGLKSDSTIEHLGEQLCYEIDGALNAFGYRMIRFEIAETPLRAYIITDELRD